MTYDEEFRKKVEAFQAEVDRDLRRLDMQMWWMLAVVPSALIMFFIIVLVR